MLSRIRAALQPPCRGQRDAGIISLYMALVVTFALVAVIELTRIWFGARAIDTNVGTVNARLEPIEQNTAQIALLMRTTTSAGQIVEATKPLSDQATEVNQTVTSINETAGSIQDTVLTINGRVSDITATAQEINGTVDELNGTVGSIEANALSIEGSASSINGTFGELLPVVQLIETSSTAQWPAGIGNINKNADVVIGLARDIRADLASILASVNSIDQHAASIEGSVPVSVVPTSGVAGSLPAVGDTGGLLDLPTGGTGNQSGSSGDSAERSESGGGLGGLLGLPG